MSCPAAGCVSDPPPGIDTSFKAKLTEFFCQYGDKIRVEANLFRKRNPMPAVRPAPIPAPIPAALPTERRAAQPPAAGAKAPQAGDRFFTALNYGVGAAGTIAGFVAIPHQVVECAPAVVRSVTTLGARAAAFSATRSGMLARLATGVAVSSTSLSHGTEYAASLAASSMKAPLIGRVVSPGVAKVMTEKVLPMANAVGAGVAILDNGNRLCRAHQQGNVAGEVIAGAQIGLNAVSAVTGFLPGKAQWIMAGAGLASLGLELAHQLGGVGKTQP